MSERRTSAIQGGPVRLTMPARVANDLDGLQRALANLADRLGHPACATGCDTLFLELEHEFSVNEASELNPQPLPPGPSPDRFVAARSLEARSLASRQVQVSVPARVTDDIDALQKAIGNILGKLGCAACCSGFDIEFRRELDFMAIDENLEVQGFGRFR
jgi:hypothetical protein